MRIINTNKIEQSKKINSICLLEDKRLVSGDDGGSIIVYDESYQPHIHIKEAHNATSPGILSLCALKNGELATSSAGSIKIWKINKDDFALIRELKEDNSWINKVIELKDGKLCSCSFSCSFSFSFSFLCSSFSDNIKIWDNKKNYECIKTLNGDRISTYSIIEVNNYIISLSYDNLLKVWDESTFQSIATIKNVERSSGNELIKLNYKTVLVGGKSRLYFIDTETFKVNEVENKSFEGVSCVSVAKNGLVLIGNCDGEIICFNLLSDEIIFKDKFHNERISGIIETEHNLISFSHGQIISIYDKISWE